MKSTQADAAASSGIARANAGDFAAAEQYFRQCLALRPDHPLASLNLANLLMRRGAASEAEGILLSQTKLPAPPVETFHLLAQLCEATGRVSEAEQYYLRTLRKLPADSATLRATAQFYDRNRASREAGKYWKRYVVLNPSDVPAAISYADDIRSESPADAIAILKRLFDGLRGEEATALVVLERLIFHKECHERTQRGLMPYHATSLGDQFFKFSGPEVAEFCELAARVVTADPKNVNARLLQCVGLFVTRRDSQIEPILEPIRGSLNDHPWLNVRDRGPFYERLAQMTDAEILQALPPTVPVLELTFADEPVVYLSCDGKYFVQFAAPLLRSLAANKPGAQVHVHIMDASEQLCADAVRLVGGLELRAALSTESLPADDKSNKKRARRYYHAIRFIRFYFHLRQYRRTLWLMDVDALFHRNPAELFAKLGNADVAMRVRPGRWEPWHQFNACVVGAAPTIGSLEYFRLVAAFIAHFYQANQMTWGIDQLAMYEIFDHLQSLEVAVALSFLDDCAVDYEYADAGIVWCNSGGEKLRSGPEELTCRDPEGARYRTLFERYQGSW